MHTANRVHRTLKPHPPDSSSPHGAAVWMTFPETEGRASSTRTSNSTQVTQVPGSSGLVPEGRLRIAQHFSVGVTRRRITSPEGMADGEQLSPNFSRPCGTRHLILIPPNVETLGYSQLSLRDREDLCIDLLV